MVERKNIFPPSLLSVLPLWDRKKDLKNKIHMYTYMMAHMTPEEEAALTEAMQLLEAQPVESTNPLVSVTNDNNIPAQREKLAILVSTGKSKEAIGVQLTHDQVKRLSDKDVEKYSKRYEAYIGNKTTESLVDSFIMLYSKVVGRVVPHQLSHHQPLIVLLPIFRKQSQQQQKTQAVSLLAKD